MHQNMPAQAPRWLNAFFPLPLPVLDECTIGVFNLPLDSLLKNEPIHLNTQYLFKYNIPILTSAQASYSPMDQAIDQPGHSMADQNTLMTPFDPYPEAIPPYVPDWMQAFALPSNFPSGDLQLDQFPLATYGGELPLDLQLQGPGTNCHGDLGWLTDLSGLMCADRPDFDLGMPDPHVPKHAPVFLPPLPWHWDPPEQSVALGPQDPPLAPPPVINESHTSVAETPSVSPDTSFFDVDEDPAVSVWNHIYPPHSQGGEDRVCMWKENGNICGRTTSLDLVKRHIWSVHFKLR